MIGVMPWSEIRRKSSDVDGTVKPNRAMRRERSPLHGKKRIVFSIDPLRWLDVACTKRRPWTVKAERRAKRKATGR